MISYFRHIRLCDECLVKKTANVKMQSTFIIICAAFSCFENAAKKTSTGHSADSVLVLLYSKLALVMSYTLVYCFISCTIPSGWFIDVAKTFTL